jgi:hypothetical protein
MLQKNHKWNLKQNLVNHDHNTRSKYDLHRHFCNTALFQKGVLSTGIELCKNLALKFKRLDNFNCFKKVKLLFCGIPFIRLRSFYSRSYCCVVNSYLL